MPTPKPGKPVRGSRTGRPIMALLDLLGPGHLDEETPGPSPDGKHDSGAGNAKPGDAKHRGAGEKQHGKRWPQVMEDSTHEKEDVRRNSPGHRRFLLLQQHRTHLLAASRSCLYGTIEISEST